MDFFDIIAELRKPNADVKKASKAMKVLGWVCAVGGLWNALFDFIFPFGKNPSGLPPSYPYIALITGVLLGILFFYSSKAILKKHPNGKRIGQLAVFLFTMVIFSFLFFVFPIETVPVGDRIGQILITIFFIIFTAQFAIPAYLGIRYLGRLPAIEKDRMDRFGPEPFAGKIKANNWDDRGDAYKDSVFPFGILGTFVFIMAVGLLPLFLFERLWGSDYFGTLFFPAFLFIFFTPIVYNYIPSSFEKIRGEAETFTGGGSIFLFSGTWPFFRLLLYDDGIEIRVMLHRFFIPYNELGEIPDKLGFFSRGVLIESNLPDVPSGIRYSGFGMSEVLRRLKRKKREFEENQN